MLSSLQQCFRGRDRVADVQPLDAIRYAPGVNLSRVVCPPFDTITPGEQRRLYELSPQNAVRLELPNDRDPYSAAASSLAQWLRDGTLVRDDAPAFYVCQQQFAYAGSTYQRRILFGRLRVEPWETGAVLPHERTFNAPKEDRLNLLHSLKLNTSPIFLIYRDSQQQIAPLTARAVGRDPDAEFSDADGLGLGLWRVDDAHLIAAITRALQNETLYVADGHHRYETALAFREECAAASEGTLPPDAPENFALVALASVDDVGLLILPIHRLVDAGPHLEDVLRALEPIFEIQTRSSLPDLQHDMEKRGAGSFGLVAAGSRDLFLLTLADPDAAELYLPDERSLAWRRLDPAIATHVILRHALNLADAQVEDIRTVWYEEDAEEAEVAVRRKLARYAVLLNPVPAKRVLAVADGGERMPQKSTFFYPKVPTGLVFNPLFAPS